MVTKAVSKDKMKKTCSNATSFVHIRSSRSVGPWPLATVRLDGLLVVIDSVYHCAHCRQQFADTRHQQKDRICQHVATMVAPIPFRHRPTLAPAPQDRVLSAQVPRSPWLHLWHPGNFLACFGRWGRIDVALPSTGGEPFRSSVSISFP